MVQVSKVILRDFPSISRRDYLFQGRERFYDMVIASYSMSELGDDSARAATLKALWDSVRKGGVLIIVEPGTPVGFKIIRSLRMMLINMSKKQGSKNPTLLAPCPHSFGCPIQDGKSWCHFIQRVQRIELQLATKSKSKAVRNFENEKFSYIIFSKGSLNKKKEEEWARLIRQPIKRGKHVTLDACTPKGLLSRFTLTKSMDKEIYRSARKAMWGDTYNTARSDKELKVKSLKEKRNWREKAEERRLQRKQKKSKLRNIIEKMDENDQTETR